MARRLMLTLAVAIATATTLLPPAAAKMEKWADLEGHRFRGEPSEVLGPFALFRTSSRSGSRVPLHLLSPEDCVRFYDAVRDKPPRAADWTQAAARLSKELLGCVQHLREGQLVAADLQGRPEPEFFIIFFGTPSEGRSWDMVGGDSGPLYWDLQRNHPGMVEAVFWTPRNTAAEQNKMAVTMNMPWLVLDPRAGTQVSTLMDLVPAEKFSLAVVSRDGVPLFSSNAENAAAIKQVFTELGQLLDLMRPDEPKSWKDRVHYLSAVHLAMHRDGNADPILVGDPLNGEALKQAGVLRFDAAIRVAAEGQVRRVSFIKPEKDLKPEMAQAIGHALLQAVFVPAVDHGRLVDGVFEYHFPAKP